MTLQFIHNYSKRTLLILVAVLYLLAITTPGIVIAQEAPTTEPSTTEEVTPETAPETTPPVTDPAPVTEPAPTTPPETQGPNSPTGPERSSYTYNPATGLYENDYYTWDPVTKKTAPKTPQSYSYNPETGRWDTTEWAYAPETGTYTPQTTSTSQAPAGSNPAQTGAPSLAGFNDTVAPTANLAAPQSLSVNAATNPGPQSLSVTKVNDNSSGYFDLFFNADISHTVDSTARTGDASVLQNTTAGNATSGDAYAMANILNMIQSVWGFGATMPNLYTADIQGGHVGDIIIDPDQISSVSGSQTNNLTVNASTDVAIQNNVDLLAQSGNATVSHNTTAGDATSGSATALANIVNMINSSIASGQSFMGVLNVHGDLDGDVLLGDTLLNDLIAANVPQTSLSLGEDSSFLANLDDNQTINNQINATAGTGNATVSHNTTGGNATSGTAQTNVTVFNVTGRQVVGTNALLVFVNVAGEWVGFITNAPEGATAAALGSGITQNTVGGGDTEINASTNAMIENNINVSAYSGDAEVSNNTTGGNATSGDATATANVTNMVNSSFSMSGWFGLLLIRVLGNWCGSFGTNTSCGDKPVSANPNAPTSTSNGRAVLATAASGTNGSANSKVKIFRASFVGDSNDSDNTGVVLASATEITPSSAPTNTPTESATAGRNYTTFVLIGLISIVFAAIFYGDRLTGAFRR